MSKTSLFDIISPIMIGPSSSHTAGAVKLGLLARNVYCEEIQKVTFRLYNSYALTGKGHGTNKGLLAGLLGFSVSDSRIKNILDSSEVKNIDYKFEYLEDFNRHPNAVDFFLQNNEFKMQISGDSIGAGRVKINHINGFKTNISGEYDTLILIYKDKPGMISNVTKLIQDEDVNVATLHCERQNKGDIASMSVCLDSCISNEIVKHIKDLDDVYIVRNVKKLDC